MGFEKEIEMAIKAAKCAAELALFHQSAGLEVETKADDSPVTMADKECERMIARMIGETFPDDGVLGEEGSRKEAESGRRWIIDPIDGTRDFVRGNPLWSVLIALEERGEVVAGVVHLPVMGQTCWAWRGGGAYRNGKRMRASRVDRVEAAVISLNSLTRIGAEFVDWGRRFWTVRCLGGTPDAMMVAAGEMEVWIEPKVAAWDLAAPQVILEEAGASFFDFSGKRTIYGGNAVGCAPGMKKAVREFLEAMNA